MSHKDMAKALALLVLENERLNCELVEAGKQLSLADERGAYLTSLLAEARAQEAKAEVSDLLARLNTAKADYQRVQAELVEVDLVLVDVGLDTFASRREAIEVSAATTDQLSERVETLLAEGDRTKANLDAMQRDRDALAAELRATRNSGFPVDARDWPLGCEVPVPQPQIAGKVVSEHGACTDGGEPVWAVVTHDLDDLLPTQRQTYIALRLKAGEDKYGTPLRVGWSRAREALEEELADGIAYAVALERRDVVAALAQVWDLLTVEGGEE